MCFFSTRTPSEVIFCINRPTFQSATSNREAYKTKFAEKLEAIPVYNNNDLLHSSVLQIRGDIEDNSKITFLISK